MTIAELGIVATSNADKAAIDLDRLTASAVRAEGATQRLSAASPAAMRPIIQDAPRASEALKGTAFQTANVTAQLQDIAVQLQAGQSPFLIALQQGTQLSMALGPEKGLRGSVSALAAGFASLVSPVNLATIGVIAFGGIAVQALTGLVPKAESATDALKRHEEEVQALVHGYKGAEDAARDYFDAAGRLPVGAAASDLQKKFADLNKEAEAFARYSRDFGGTLSASFGSTEQEVGALLRSFGDGQRSASDLVTQLTILGNTDLGPLGFILRSQLINPLIDAAQKARLVEDALVSLSHIAAGLGESTDLRFALDNRVAGERAAQSHQIELDAIKAKTPAQLADIARRREALRLADDQITEALRQQKIDEAGELAYARAADAQARSGQKIVDAYQNVLRAAQQRTAQAQIETQALGMTEGAAARLRAQHELLTAAQNAGVTITADVRETLIGEANAAAEAEERLRLMTKAHEEHQRVIQQTTDALAGAAAALFKPWKDLDGVVSNVMGSFASIGQSNLKSGLDNLINGTGSLAANDNGGWNDVWSKVGNAVRDGAKEGTSGGLTEFLKGNAGNIGAGVGGLGIGYQTQNPLMGALGGALAGASVGPWGAVIGGVAGLVGGLIGMNAELEKGRKLLTDNKQSITAFIGAGFGQEIDKTTAAVIQYKAQAAEYIELAKAAGDTALVKRLQAAAAAYHDTLKAQERIDKLQDKVDTQRDRLRDAYERESAALRDVIDRSKAFVESMQDFKKSLLLDSNLSPLSPQDRLIQAQMQFQSTSTAALGGDAAAQARLLDAATSYLEQARNFYASSSGYASIFDQVQSVLDRAISSGTAQVSDAERQLSKMTEQVSKLIDINTNVVSVAKAIAKLESTMAKLSLAQIEQQKDTNKALKAQGREASQQSGKRAA